MDKSAKNRGHPLDNAATIVTTGEPGQGALCTRTCTADSGVRRYHQNCHLRFRGSRGMAPSSISSPSGAVGVSDSSCSPPGARDAKWMVLSSGGLPQPGLVIVSRDHSTVGPRAAFFNDSMRREAMTGTKVVFALQNEGLNQLQLLRGYLGINKTEELTPRARVGYHSEHALDEHTMRYSLGIYITYRGDEQK